jgi:hypothetical protein
MDIRNISLIFGLAAAFSHAVPQLDGTYWNFYSDTRWDVMYFERNGNRVSSEYIHDKGVLSATLSGDTLKGWWRELNNPPACGPGDSWSGAILFLFDSTGTKFTGSSDFCDDSTALNPHASDWVGTKRDSAFTQAECEQAYRYWCDGKCLLAPCGSEVAEWVCEDSGHFWCGDSCSMKPCGISAVRSGRRRRRILDRMPMSRATPVDVNGRCLDSRLKPAKGVYLAP